MKRTTFLIACLLSVISVQAMNKTNASSAASSSQTSAHQFTLTVKMSMSVGGNGLIEEITLQYNDTESCLRLLRMLRIDDVVDKQLILAPGVGAEVDVGSNYESKAHKELLASTYEKAKKKFLTGTIQFNDKTALLRKEFNQTDFEDAGSSSSSSSSSTN